jgi:hypothetical protein
LYKKTFYFTTKEIIMKSIIIVALIAGLTGCQGSPSLTANKLSELSNEDLCHALGTYNHDGELVLKISDELKKRPEKIDPERCYILEKLKTKQRIEFKEKNIRTNTPYTDDIKTNPSHSNNDFYQHIDPQHHKIIHNPRKNNKDKKTDSDNFERVNSLNRISAYNNESYIREGLRFSTKEMVTDKIDMKEEDMGAIMRECLKKHISKSHTNSDK